jgi:hypothetical protein
MKQHVARSQAFLHFLLVAYFRGHTRLVLPSVLSIVVAYGMFQQSSVNLLRFPVVGMVSFPGNAPQHNGFPILIGVLVFPSSSIR